MDLSRRVRQLRHQAGLTQEELARKADVSQSLITKVETGRTQPTYQTAKQILAVLESSGSVDGRASDVMEEHVIAVSPSATVDMVVNMLRSNDISQLPVLSDRVVGMVTESCLLESEWDGSDPVRDVMVASPPTVNVEAPMTILRSLLQHAPMVLVMKRGDVEGVVTKADVLQV